MTLTDLQKLPVFQSRGIAAACGDSPETYSYITDCIVRFWAGDYGEAPTEDTAANNADLDTGEGHVLARYKAAHNLQGDIYIESYFSKTAPGINSNNTMIMYCNER